jgi:F420-dependent oxidoreductase-like protein
MHLRIFTEPQQGADYETLRRIAQTSEDCGFDAFFRSDHYLKMGSASGLPGPTDAWSVIAGLARDTKKIRLGTLMTAATFRLPGPLAIAVATIDNMSGGRVEFGLGAGWYEAEHTAYGIPFPPTKQRFDRFAEQLEIMTGLWSTPMGETFSFHGKEYRLEGSPALPKPAQDHIPILVGGSGPKRTPMLAARFADEYNVGFQTPEETAQGFERGRRARAEIGRTKPLIQSGVQVVCCGRDDAEVKRRAARIGRTVEDLKEHGVAGSPAEIVEKLGRFAAIGCERMYLQVLDPADLEHVELIATQVLPQAARL